MTQLTEQFHVPEEYHEACDRLTKLVRKHARRLLREEYWQDYHLEGIQAHADQSYTYIRDDDIDCFEDTDEYLYSRFKRCVYHRVTHILEAHADEYQVFHFITDTVEERKIRGIGWHHLRTRLLDDPDSPYLPWSVLENVTDKLNRHYDVHGRFPEEYTDLVDVPKPNGTLPYAPDKGDYHIHDLSVEGDDLVVVLNAPDSLSPESYHDWTEHELRFPLHTRFHGLLEAGEGLGAPTLHASPHGYTIDVPIDVPDRPIQTVENRVLAVDLGVKKQATVVPVERGEYDGHIQVAPPRFIDHPAKDKLFRVKADAEGVNDRLAELRRQGKAHTERFDHLLCEYRRTRRRERRLRSQIQHDVANELVWLAILHDCEEIVFESLGELGGSGHSGRTAWSISSWARGKLLEFVEYKANLLDIAVETVNPWGTSRYCPQCGERGTTVKAPNDHTEARNGGHFHCPECGYECDRDAVGAVNVGRKHLDTCKMEEANPVEYSSTGNHASFSSHAVEGCDRSAGVQSASDEQDVASGCQTRLFQRRSPSLTVKRSGTKQGGLHRNHSRETGLRWSSGSITEWCLLVSTADCSAMVLNPAEN